MHLRSLIPGTRSAHFVFSVYPQFLYPKFQDLHRLVASWQIGNNEDRFSRNKALESYKRICLACNERSENTCKMPFIDAPRTKCLRTGTELETVPRGGGTERPRDDMICDITRYFSADSGVCLHFTYFGEFYIIFQDGIQNGYQTPYWPKR